MLVKRSSGPGQSRIGSVQRLAARWIAKYNTLSTEALSEAKPDASKPMEKRVSALRTALLHGRMGIALNQFELLRRDIGMWILEHPKTGYEVAAPVFRMIDEFSGLRLRKPQFRT